MYDKRKYVVHIRTLKQSLNNGLVREKVVKKLSHNKLVFRKFISNQNEENKTENEQTTLSRSINIRH